MRKIFAFFLLMAVPFSAADAELGLSELVVDLQAGKHDREDVEIANSGPDRAYVEIDPREIVDPGTPAETPREEPDPQKLGLLVSPARLILEPGQRRLIRVATLAPSADRERVYRITVKPVVGKLASTQSGLKVLLGYDMLVLVRPSVPNAAVSATRAAASITFRNGGNVSVELSKGKQCDAAARCTDLADKRLYAGASWTEPLKGTGTVEYQVDSPGKSERLRF